MRNTILILFIALTFGLSAQHGHGRGGHPRGVHQAPRRVVVVHRSPYRPHRVVVYHPAWGPHFAYNRRWVYFPRRNFYWDNWRNHWVFFNGVVWISQPALPPGVSQKELEQDKKRELPEKEDDVDDVYKGNDQHKKEPE